MTTFYAATKATEGADRFLYDYFTTLQWLLDEIDAWRNKFDELALSDFTFDYLSVCCAASWATCEKYYKLVDKTPIYYAAVIVNSTLKKRYFIDQSQEGTSEQQAWIFQVEKQVKELWHTNYKQRVSTLPSVDVQKGCCLVVSRITAHRRRRRIRTAE